jgi:CrcB protein
VAPPAVVAAPAGFDDYLASSSVFTHHHARDHDMPTYEAEPFSPSNFAELTSDLDPRNTGHDALPNLEDAPASTPPPPTISPSTPTNTLQLARVQAYLAIFSILGTLARLGLVALTSYPGTPLGGVIWANFTGCVAMGFLIEDSRLLSAYTSPHAVPEDGDGDGDGGEDEGEGMKTGGGAGPGGAGRSKATHPLYAGLTTGFCGSLTSFSSFLLSAFQNLADVAPSYPRSRGQDFLAVSGYVISTVCLSLSGLRFGAHLAALGRGGRRGERAVVPVIPSWLLRAGDWLAFPLAAGMWVACVVMAVFIPVWRGEVLFACVFSPLGTFTRFWVSRWLNPRVASFPLGTFAVNVGGTLVLAGVTLGRDLHRSGGAGCQVLRGVGDGFCGCLTTVSTFAAELIGLRVGRAYIYGAVSVGLGLVIMVVVLGSFVSTCITLILTSLYFFVGGIAC